MIPFDVESLVNPYMYILPSVDSIIHNYAMNKGRLISTDLGWYFDIGKQSIVCIFIGIDSILVDCT